MDNFVTFTLSDNTAVVVNASLIRRITTKDSARHPSTSTTVLWFDAQDHVEVLGDLREVTSKIEHFRRYVQSLSPAQQQSAQETHKPSEANQAKGTSGLSRVLGRGT